MPDSKFDLGDYVEVRERIRVFYDRFGDGRLVTYRYELTSDPDDKPKVIVEAHAYRTPDDPHPGRGLSWMYLPGTTNYTRGSELENVETSAWGRAIASLGILVDRSVASANEVRNKADDTEAKAAPDFEHGENGSLIGEVEIGKPPADFELRETPEGHVLAFRLRSGRKSIKVVAYDTLAEALALVMAQVVGARAQCWGVISDETFTPKGSTKSITYQTLRLHRIATPDLVLPADLTPDPKSDAADPVSDEAEPARAERPQPAPQTPAGTPPTKEAAAAPPAEADAEALVAPVLCGDKGSLDTICTLLKGHSGKHRELATDGRVLASW